MYRWPLRKRCLRYQNNRYRSIVNKSIFPMLIAGPDENDRRNHVHDLELPGHDRFRCRYRSLDISRYKLLSCKTYTFFPSAVVKPSRSWNSHQKVG